MKRHLLAKWLIVINYKLRFTFEKLASVWLYWKERKNCILSIGFHLTTLKHVNKMLLFCCDEKRNVWSDHVNSQGETVWGTIWDQHVRIQSTVQRLEINCDSFKNKQKTQALQKDCREVTPNHGCSPLGEGASIWFPESLLHHHPQATIFTSHAFWPLRVASREAEMKAEQIFCTNTVLEAVSYSGLHYIITAIS